MCHIKHEKQAWKHLGELQYWLLLYIWEIVFTKFINTFKWSLLRDTSEKKSRVLSRKCNIILFKTREQTSNKIQRGEFLGFQMNTSMLYLWAQLIPFPQESICSSESMTYTLPWVQHLKKIKLKFAQNEKQENHIT